MNSPAIIRKERLAPWRVTDAMMQEQDNGSFSLKICIDTIQKWAIINSRYRITPIQIEEDALWHTVECWIS